MLNASVLRNQNGNAMIEIVPILAVFILLVNFALGFFGIIHSGILNSISARNYAFETFRNRADLSYLRDEVGQGDGNYRFTYRKSGLRFHATKNETIESSDQNDAFYATRRPLKFTDIGATEDQRNESSSDYHNRLKRITEGQRASESGIDEGVNPVWVRTVYGICLNATCGG